jgi:hypothetical protein
MGRSGFIQTNIVPPVPEGKQDVVCSTWERGGVLLILCEHPTMAPELLNYRTFEPVDPDMLGLRNPNIQEKA